MRRGGPTEPVTGGEEGREGDVRDGRAGKGANEVRTLLGHQHLPQDSKHQSQGGGRYDTETIH